MANFQNDVLSGINSQFNFLYGLLKKCEQWEFSHLCWRWKPQPILKGNQAWLCWTLMFSKGTHLTFISMSCACVFVCGYLSVLEAIEDGSKPFKRNQKQLPKTMNSSRIRMNIIWHRHKSLWQSHFVFKFKKVQFLPAFCNLNRAHLHFINTACYMFFTTLLANIIQTNCLNIYFKLYSYTKKRK